MTLKSQQIRAKLDTVGNGKGELGGWLSGRNTYLWFGVGGNHQGTLGGPKLLRLAKAIVRHMEGDKS